MKEQIRWNATNGKEITITVELILSETIWADGDRIEVKCCEMDIRAEAEGIGTLANDAPYKRDNIKSPLGNAVAVMGKLALNQEKYDLVMATIAKVESTPEWQAKLADIDAAAKADEKYEDHYAKVMSAMNQ